MRAFTLIDAEQRSDVWKQARLGRLTGSVASQAFATNKDGKWAASRRNLLLRLVLERITGLSGESDFVSAAMQAGIDREPDARKAYEGLTGQPVEQSGFLMHLDLLAGCSLDGHHGDFAHLLSIKCRQPNAHLEFLRSGKVPTDALIQMRHEAWMTDAETHTYFSWNPQFPEALQARMVTLTQDTLDLPGYDRRVRAFLAECDTEYEAIRTMHEPAVVLREAVEQP